MFRKNRKHEQPSLLSDIGMMGEAQRKRLEASWAQAFREHCFSQIDCRAQPRKRDPRFILSFTQEEVFRAKRQQRHRALCAAPGNPRAAVEATVRSLKHPFRHGKVPVRGLFRVTCMVIASAAMVNLRRIHHFGLHSIQLFLCWISLTLSRKTYSCC